MSLLTISDVYGGYDGSDILNGINITVNTSEIVVIIGPNGAGKSTAMKSVFGLVNIRSGSVAINNKDITNQSGDKIVEHGVCFVPQTDNIFPTLTVEENLEMGAYLRSTGRKQKIEEIYQLFPPLRQKRKQPAGQLSGGQRQMVAIGRALMLDPQLLLLDEPTAGLSPKYIEQIFSIITDVNILGIAILMVEQNAKQALKIANRGYVLTTGKNRFEDTGANLLANREVAKLFLGG